MMLQNTMSIRPRLLAVSTDSRRFPTPPTSLGLHAVARIVANTDAVSAPGLPRGSRVCPGDPGEAPFLTSKSLGGRATLPRGGRYPMDNRCPGG